MELMNFRKKVVVVLAFVCLVLVGCFDNISSNQIVKKKTNKGRLKLIEQPYNEPEMWFKSGCIDFHMDKHNSFKSIGSFSIVDSPSETDLYLSMKGLDEGDGYVAFTFAILDHNKGLVSHSIYSFQRIRRVGSENFLEACRELAELIVDAKMQLSGYK